MSLCINPHCTRLQNPDNLLFCQGCGSELLIEGQYRVIRQLGEGGFGKTFEVSHSDTVKVLKVLILDDAKAISLFQQEARVQVPTNTTLDIYLQKTINQLPSYLRVVDVETNAAEGYEVGQVMIELGDTNKQITYFFKAHSTIWTVAFFARNNEFELYRPIFEKSFYTLKTQ